MSVRSSQSRSRRVPLAYNTVSRLTTCSGCGLHPPHRPGPIEDLLVVVCEQVYADRLTDPFFAMARFVDLLRQHAAPGWEAVVGYDGAAPVG